jgi:hypothetical protein
MVYHDQVHALHKGVLYFQNVIRFTVHAQMKYGIIYAQKKKITFRISAKIV